MYAWIANSMQGSLPWDFRKEHRILGNFKYFLGRVFFFSFLFCWTSALRFLLTRWQFLSLQFTVLWATNNEKVAVLLFGDSFVHPLQISQRLLSSSTVITMCRWNVKYSKQVGLLIYSIYNHCQWNRRLENRKMYCYHIIGCKYPRNCNTQNMVFTVDLKGNAKQI